MTEDEIAAIIAAHHAGERPGASGLTDRRHKPEPWMREAAAEMMMILIDEGREIEDTAYRNEAF